MPIDEEGQLRRILQKQDIGLPYLLENWRRALAPDATVWTIGLGGTGSVDLDLTEEPYTKMVLTGPANGDTARIYSIYKWQLGPDTWNTNTFNQGLIMEWECKFATVASIENPEFFMGLSAGAAAQRSTMNIAGFCLTADVLNAITDDGGVETVSAMLAPPTLTNWLKLKIVARPGVIEFWVDEVFQVRHTTADAQNLPDVNVCGQFYLEQEAGANGGELHLGTVSIRPEGTVR